MNLLPRYMKKKDIQQSKNNWKIKLYITSYLISSLLSYKLVLVSLYVVSEVEISSKSSIFDSMNLFKSF